MRRYAACALFALVVTLPPGARGAPDPGLDPEGDVQGLVGRLRSDLAGAKHDLELAGAAIDPTSTPYPKGRAETASEEQRVAEWLKPRLPGLPAGAAATVAEARGVGVSDIDLFHGSHVVTSDAGALYERWAKRGAVARVSSHYPDVHVQQYETPLKEMGVLLFGKTAEGNTWFQMEAFGSRGVDALAHVGEYVRHEVTGGMNIGPLGLSPYTDARGNPRLASNLPNGL